MRFISTSANFFNVLKIAKFTSFAFVQLVLMIFCLNQSYADPYPQGLGLSKLQLPPRQIPTTENGITYFHIYEKGCSETDYGDGRGESDCKNGNVRSSLVGKLYVPLGSTVTYAFDIWVTPTLLYNGERDDNAFAILPKGWDSKLRLATWEGDRVHNFIYSLKVDTAKGITFLSRTCQEPRDLGKWLSFSMKVKWANDSTGVIAVSCDGREIYHRENAVTAENPQCYPGNQCEPGKKKNPKEFVFVIGPVMAGRGPVPDRFRQVQPGGIEVRVRDFNIKFDYY